jgi:hypothetical protein
MSNLRPGGGISRLARRAKPATACKLPWDGVRGDL